jgi:tetratricopeptide (TPR) repeat protein
MGPSGTRQAASTRSFALDTTWALLDAGHVDDESLDPVADLPWQDPDDRRGDDVAEREVRARIRAHLLGQDHEPLRIGRFRLVRKLGEGGMGTVHAAYDDELRREVAIKLLHADACDDENAQLRLLREAQAQARLSHPHLVPVFEVGRFEDRIFLAMELVDGVTMTQWLAMSAARSPRAILAHWLDVARALVVVHAEGLVHRDIKPSNVLVGTDGRARLVDFGLARGQPSTVERSPTEPGEDTSSETAGRSALERVVTQARARLGTPAYMAPEVCAGQPAGPLADQYSLCVSIYESLVGRRPFGFVRLAEGPGPARESLPRALHRVLARGLAYDPTARFPDVRALVAALEPIVDRRRERRLAIGAALLSAVVAGGVAVQAIEPPPVAPVDPCAEVADDLASVWDDASRAGLQQGMLATQSPHAAELSAWVEHGVDELAGQWLAARRDACEAHVVDRVLSSAGFARATECLDGQREALSAIVHVTPTVERLPNLASAIMAIEPPTECLQRARFETAVQPPPDDRKAAVESLRATLQRTRVAAVLEGAEPHREAAQAAHAEAEALGYDPLRAEAALVLGRMLAADEDPGARSLLDDAANLAERVGDPAIRESALYELAYVAYEVELDEEELRRALARDDAALRRMGDPPSRRARLLELTALLAAMSGDFAAAEARLRDEIALRTALGDAHVPGRIAAWHNLGNLLAGRGRTDEAEQAFTEADRLVAEAGLPAVVVVNGSVARGRGELLRGIAATNSGRFDDAARWLDRAAAETTLAYGTDGVPMSRIHMAQADLAMRQGRIEDVLAHARAADENVRRWLGDDHVLRMDALSALGTIAFHQGRAADAVAAFEEALRLAEGTLPASGMEVATHRSNLGEARVLAGDDAVARPLLEAALESMEHTLSPTDPLISYPSHGLAEIAWRAGDLEQAARHARRALEIREHHGDDPPELARVRWLLARIEAARGNVPQALELARAAHDGFEALGPAFAATTREIDAWLREPPQSSQ